MLRRTVSVTVELKWSIQVVSSLLTITHWLMFVFCIFILYHTGWSFDTVPVNSIPDVPNRHWMGCWNEEPHVSINLWLCVCVCVPAWANGKTGSGHHCIHIMYLSLFNRLLLKFVIIQEESLAQMWIPTRLFTCLSLYTFKNCLLN